MLLELSVVEQRYLAVREALDTGATITDVATRYGIDRRTFTGGWSATRPGAWRLWGRRLPEELSPLTRQTQP